MRAWIGLGSNVGDGAENIADALGRLNAISGAVKIRCSGLYRSEPWGLSGQADFTNAVAELSVALEAMNLLAGLQAIETAMGRRPGARRWSERIIDLDILLLDDHIFYLPGLTVPHPRMHQRRFVLQPLFELEPQLEIPGRGSVAALLARVSRQRVTRID